MITYSQFSEFFFLACQSTTITEFMRWAEELEFYSEQIAESGILYSIWLFSVDHTSVKIRNFTGMNRAGFCRRYNLPERTVVNWDQNKNYPGDWVLNLLCYAVLSDVHSAEKAKAPEKMLIED